MNAVKNLAVVVAAFALTYAAVVFVTLEPDVRAWTSDGRGTLVFISFLISGTVLAWRASL